MAHWDELFMLRDILEHHEIERRRRIRIYAEALHLAMEEMHDVTRNWRELGPEQQQALVQNRLNAQLEVVQRARNLERNGRIPRVPNNQNGWLEAEPEVPAWEPEVNSDTSTITDVED